MFSRQITVALAGNPNRGKTTIFNALALSQGLFCVLVSPVCLGSCISTAYLL